MHILMIAAENGAVPGGKVGGLGDVIRDIPIALAKAGHKVSVITPGYGTFVRSKQDRLIKNFAVPFCGSEENVNLHRLKLSGAGKSSSAKDTSTVTHWALEHWLFSASGAGQIYSQDHYGPFATDAYKFALFSAAVCQLVTDQFFSDVDVLHCHDWHTAPVLFLRRYDESFSSLKKIKTVFSIHNLSYQGIRPLSGDVSSLEHWFPNLKYQLEIIADPTHTDCVNLMRVGINLSDCVHTVSPTYAQEILQPSNAARGFIGGEGLQQDLIRADISGNLIGILNGCNYDNYEPEEVGEKKLWRLIDRSLDQWVKQDKADHHSHHYRSYYFALRRLLKLSRQRKPVRPVLISVGRLTEQKLKLLTTPCGQHSVLEELLQRIDPGIFILLGSGDGDYEKLLASIMHKHSNFLFLCGFSEKLSDALYQFGDAFVMPSSFEPCGISQLLALRAGVPCVVHAIGGLKDTIVDHVTGFSFSGNSEIEQGEDFLRAIDSALTMYHNDQQAWQNMRIHAAQQRFTWDSAAQQYIDLLYTNFSEKGKLKLVAKQG